MSSEPASSPDWIRIVLSLVLVVGLLGLGAAMFTRLSQKTPPARGESGVDLPPLIRARTAVREDFQEHVRVYGVARALRTLPVIAEVGGRIEWLDRGLEIGRALEVLDRRSTSGEGRTPGPDGVSPEAAPSDVPADDRNLIARLDTRDVIDRLSRASADLAAIQAELDRLLTQRQALDARLVIASEELGTAQRERERIAALVPATLPRSDLDRQELQVTARRTQMTLLQGNLDDNTAAQVTVRARLAAQRKTIELETRAKARHRIERTQPGVITRRLVEEGDLIQAGQRLLELMDLSVVEVPLSVPAGHYPHVHVGDPVTLVDPRDGRVLLDDARIARKAPAIDDARRTFAVFVEVPGTPTSNPLPPGTHVRAELGSQEHGDVIAVPRQALLEGQVFVAQPVDQIGEERVFEVEVREPAFVRLLPGVALVRSGIEAGERYLLTNLESVAAGTRIRVQDDADDPEPSAPSGEPGTERGAGSDGR